VGVGPRASGPKWETAPDAPVQWCRAEPARQRNAASAAWPAGDNAAAAEGRAVVQRTGEGDGPGLKGCAAI
jgi:hypothetical protein